MNLGRLLCSLLAIAAFSVTLPQCSGAGGSASTAPADPVADTGLVALADTYTLAGTYTLADADAGFGQSRAVEP